MSLADRAVWCVICGDAPTFAISSERGDVIAHWGACHEHLLQVAARILSARDTIEYERLRGQASAARADAPVIEADETMRYEIEEMGSG